MNPTTVIIDLEEHFETGNQHHEHDPGTIIIYRFKVDSRKHDTEHRHISGAAIFAFTDKSPEHHDLFQIFKEHGKVEEKLVSLEQSVDLKTFGIEKFITKEKKYCFSIDKVRYETEHERRTVRQILVDFAKVSPDDKTLVEKRPDGPHEYKDLNEEILLKDCPHFTLFDNTPTTVS